jgi:hypothetical protein
VVLPRYLRVASKNYIRVEAVRPLLGRINGGHFGEASRRVSVLLRSSALLQLLHYFIHVEAGRLLPLRIVLEGHKELAHIGLRRN